MVDGRWRAVDAVRAAHALLLAPPGRTVFMCAYHRAAVCVCVGVCVVPHALLLD